MEPRPPRCRPLPPDVVAMVAATAVVTPDAELLDRLEAALAALPEPERLAVVAAHGYGDPAAVPQELGLSDADAETLTRNALQLLRGALADADPGPAQDHGRLVRRRSRPRAD
jgi:DNA-directed RNA polymerase specialized sigma24 family protein